MEAFIAEKQKVTMDELKNQFQVSMNTVRSDIKYLEKKGIVKKIYGGVEIGNHAEMTAFESRTEKRSRDKYNIAETAAHYITEGDIIFIDSGTTTSSIIDFIDDKISLTIITNNLVVLTKALQKNNINVIALPGSLARKTLSLCDTTTPQYLERLNLNKAFIATTAINAEGVLTNASELECQIKKTALKRSSYHILMADSSKFGTTSLLDVARLSDFHIIITDNKLEKKYRDKIKSSSLVLV